MWVSNGSDNGKAQFDYLGGEKIGLRGNYARKRNPQPVCAKPIPLILETVWITF